MIPAGTSDADAVQAVLAGNTPVLLVPFHGHNDAEGRRLDGIRFLQELDQASPRKFDWRVVMPVSMFAVPAVRAMLARGEIPQRVRDRLLMLTEDELDATAATRIRDHVSV